MKRVMMLMGFVFTGFVTAAIVIRIMTAFDNNPGCGLDCASPELEAALLSGLATVLAFPILGFFFTRKRTSTTRRIAATLSTLMLVAILLAFVHYVFNLHTRYLRAEAARPVQPDLDFMYMEIATRDVQTYTELKKGQPQSVGMINGNVVQLAVLHAENNQGRHTCYARAERFSSMKPTGNTSP